MKSRKREREGGHAAGGRGGDAYGAAKVSKRRLSASAEGSPTPQQVSDDKAAKRAAEEGEAERRAARKAAKRAAKEAARRAEEAAAEAAKAAKRAAKEAARRAASDAAAGADAERAAKAARKAAKAAATAAAEEDARRHAKILKVTAKLRAAADGPARAGLQAKLAALLAKAKLGAAADTVAAAAAAAASPAAAGQQQQQQPPPRVSVSQRLVCSNRPPAPQPQPPKQQQGPKPAAIAFAAPQRQQGPGAIAGLQLTQEERARRELRQRRFAPELEQQKQELRRQRAAAANGGGSGGEAGATADDGEGAGHLRLGCLGTCASLEKDYLRLTRLPLASEVRPPAVLRRALAMVKRRWAAGEVSYPYAWRQLKSMRQDLTVQGVADELAVDVYETHGRVALETGDTAEFRQCLAVLRRLYALGVPGNAPEFAAYGVLAAAGHGPALLSHELARLDPALLEEAPVQHALEAARAARSGAYLRFMQLYATAPRMSPYLMDALLERVRARGLRALVAAHSPLPLPLEWVAAQLGFEGAGEAGAWAAERGAAVDARAGQLLTRESRAAAAGPPAPARAGG